MTEREKMYSALIYREVEIKGKRLKFVASLLDLDQSKAWYYKYKYKPEFEEYNSMTIEKIIKMRAFAKHFLAKTRKRAKTMYEKRMFNDKSRSAFHMPISDEERKQYNAIARLVALDEYLPIGYRKNTDKAPIVSNQMAYSAPVVEKTPQSRIGKKRYSFEWTPEREEEMRMLYPCTPTSELADRFGVNVRVLYDQAHKMGLKRISGFTKKVNK